MKGGASHTSCPQAAINVLNLVLWNHHADGASAPLRSLRRQLLRTAPRSLLPFLLRVCEGAPSTHVCAKAMLSLALLIEQDGLHNPHQPLLVACGDKRLPAILDRVAGRRADLARHLYVTLVKAGVCWHVGWLTCCGCLCCVLVCLCAWGQVHRPMPAAAGGVSCALRRRGGWPSCERSAQSSKPLRDDWRWPSCRHTRQAAGHGSSSHDHCPVTAFQLPVPQAGAWFAAVLACRVVVHRPSPCRHVSRPRRSWSRMPSWSSLHPVSTHRRRPAAHLVAPRLVAVTATKPRSSGVGLCSSQRPCPNYRRSWWPSECVLQRSQVAVPRCVSSPPGLVVAPTERGHVSFAAPAGSGAVCRSR